MEFHQEDKILSGPDAFYSGFENMANNFLHEDGKSCTDMDKERTCIKYLLP